MPTQRRSSGAADTAPGASTTPPPARHRLATLGPGILMASAAIGGSHLVSSTQAGANFGWQLFGLVIIANVMKYPFFRFGPQYTAETGKSLVEGYADKGRAYLWVFFALCAVSSVVSTAGVALLAASILAFAVPASWGLGVPVLAVVVIGSTLVLLLTGRYRALDWISKLIVTVLALVTVVAVVFAAMAGSQMQPGFVEPSPWNFATLGFLIALMGWMPAPIEVSALNSLWIKAKVRDRDANPKDILFDFNVGFVTSAVLALFFVALGALVQYGSGTEISTASGAYIAQLIAMYAATIGPWAAPMMTLLAFFVMYGTTITVVDGYARANAEAVRLLRGRPAMSRGELSAWTVGIALVGLVIVLFMASSLAAMLNFAMISAFVTAPVFAWLNFSLVRRGRLSVAMRVLAWAGLAFLIGFTLLFGANLLGLVG
ncbi:divalent metal cation transporter [Propioniciclava soli]|uniref:Divalent metal cation transporter n=1 Tax=Propioniciclava soli TaxID=2775081 RepID=A0ABZ3C4B7_9ACTN